MEGRGFQNQVRLVPSEELQMRPALVRNSTDPSDGIRFLVRFFLRGEFLEGA